MVCARKMLFQYLLVILIFLVIASVRKRPKKLLDLHRQIKVRFPYVPVIGQAYKFMGSNEDRMMFMTELARESYKNKHSIVSLWLFNDLYASISEPASASVVFKASSDKGLLTLYGRHLLGNGSVFGDEEIWRLRRKILTPMFAPKYFNNFVQVFERNNNIMMEKLAAVVGEGDFSIWEYLSSYTLDSALDMIFGENVEAHRKQSFVEAIQDYCRLGAERVIRPWLCSTALFRLLPADARGARDKRLIWDFVETLIREKKAALSNDRRTSNNANTTARCTTFLELLIKYSGGEDGYSDTELREETLVLVLAATDTTATAAGFAALLLARHPRVQDRVHQELRKVLGDSEKPVSVDDLVKLKYLDTVVRESMRLYPPAPVTLRKCNRDVELPSGLILPAGCVAMLNIWGVHRNPQCWGADADVFRPERFLRASAGQRAAFMPFGHGPRSCTGARLALASVKLTLAELTRRYRVAPATRCERSERSEPLRVTFEIMLKHVHGFKVRLEKRN